jgi:hypothetical protein
MIAPGERRVSSQATGREFPKIEALHESHSGMTAALCSVLAESVSVVLTRCDFAPPTLFDLHAQSRSSSALLVWQKANERRLRAYQNQDDSVRDAAYGVAIAAVEIETDLRVVSRADTRSGADYYLDRNDLAADQPKEATFEGSYRLEVSGVGDGDADAVRQRLHSKRRQLSNGRSDKPGIAGVVGFRARLILFALEA